MFPFLSHMTCSLLQCFDASNFGVLMEKPVTIELIPIDFAEVVKCYI